MHDLRGKMHDECVSLGITANYKGSRLLSFNSGFINRREFNRVRLLYCENALDNRVQTSN